MRKPAPPITAHRLFPVLVALWFAALFGLGSFAVQPDFLARIVVATGLPALVPAAAPPLGATARLLVAVMMTGLGAALGLVIALRLKPRAQAPARRRMAGGAGETESARTTRSRDAHPDAPVCTPLVLSEELMGDLPPVSAPALDPVASVEPAWLAAPIAESPEPVVAVDPEPFGLSQDALSQDEADACDALPGTEVIADTASGPEPETRPEPESAAEVVPATLAEPSAPVARPIFATPLSFAPGNPRSPVADAPLDSLGLVQLIERLALAIADRRAAQDAAAPVDGPATEPDTGPVSGPVMAPVVAEPAPARLASPVVVQPPAPAPIPRFASPQAADAALVSRSPLFRQALERSALPAADTPQPEADAFAAPFAGHAVDALASDDQSLAHLPLSLLVDETVPPVDGIIPSPYSPLVQKPVQRVVPLRPAAFEPLDESDAADEGEDYAVPRFLGLGAGTVGQAGADGASDDADGEEDLSEQAVPEARYSSLTDMAAPQPRQEFIRIDEPAMPADEPGDAEPVVVFPGHAPFARPAQATAGRAPQVFVAPESPAADPGEADRALRAALATLQRMTAKG